MLRKLDPQICELLSARDAAGVPPSSMAVLAFDASSPLMAGPAGLRVPVPPPSVEGRYVVVSAPVDVAVSLARLFAEMTECDRDAAARKVRDISGDGYTVILAQTGMACGAYEARSHTLSPGGSA
jgi:hypothetical protein